MLRVNKENFGIEDPEFQRPGETTADRLGFLQEAFAFLDEITQERRRNPRNDLWTVLAKATIGGQPVPQLELFSLYFLVMVAGHDTTRNAISLCDSSTHGRPKPGNPLASSSPAVDGTTEAHGLPSRPAWPRR